MNNFTSRFMVLLTMLTSWALMQAQPRTRNTSEGATLRQTAPEVMKKTEGEWKSMGVGRYRDDFIPALYVVDPVEFDVEVQESVSVPGLYRVVSPYKNYPGYPAVFDGDTYLEFDATAPDKVYMKRYDTGMDWGGGSIGINSVAYYRLVEDGSLDGAYADGECGSLIDGVITFPADKMLVQEDIVTGSGTDIWRLANNFGMFRLVLPGAPDLDISININGPENKDGNQYISVSYNIGKDCESVKVAMLEGDYNEGMTDGIISGTFTSQEITAGGDVLFPYDKDGIYTFIAVPYLQGKPRRTAYKTQELSYLDVDWESIGKAIYNEGFFSDHEPNLMIGMDEDAVMEVEVQQRVADPGYYRLVDPYGPGYIYSSNANYDTTRRYYMEIDATDPDRVVIKEMEDGCGLDVGLGKMYLWCNADRYISQGMYTAGEVDDMNLYGKLDGRVITFPNQSLCLNIPKGRDAWYWANWTGKFRVELPEGAGVCNIIQSDSDMCVEYYNLQGMKIDRNDITPGIYIRRCGNKSVKVVI